MKSIITRISVLVLLLGWLEPALCLENSARGSVLTESRRPAGTSKGGPLTVGFVSAAESVVEEDGPTSISVQLSKTSTRIVKVDYGISGGDATPGSDFASISGTLSFAPGETSKMIAISILDDDEPEFDETVEFSLSHPSNAKLGLSTMVLTILDPVDGDPPPPPTPPYYLDAEVLSPFSVKLVWQDPNGGVSIFDVYRGSDPQTLSKIYDGSRGQTIYFDTGPTPGTTQYYQVREGQGSSEVVSVEIPTEVDTSLSLLPGFELEWSADAYNYHDSRATLRLHFSPEDSTLDPAGWILDLWVDDDASEAGSLGGAPNSFEPAFGRDDLAYLVGTGRHYGPFTLQGGDADIIEISDLAAGVHNFRYRVHDLSGRSFERSFIRQINPDFIDLGNLFGDVVGSGSGRTKTLRPRLFGFGPQGRFSSDCQDADPRYSVSFKARPSLESTNSYYWPVVGTAYTDENGYWEFVPSQDLPTFDPGDRTKTIELLVMVAGLQTGYRSGRSFPNGDGSIFEEMLQDERENRYYGATRKITMVYQKKTDGLPKLELGTQPTTVVIDSLESVAPSRIRFRIIDLGQDLVPSSVSVTNATLGQDAELFMKPNQGWNGADPNLAGAWWQADLPLAPGANEIIFHAEHDGRKSMTESVIFNREVPDVVARISRPTGEARHSYAMIPVDASLSEGPSDMVFRWVFMERHYCMSEWYNVSIPDAEIDQATGTVVMPVKSSGMAGGMTARLVVMTTDCAADPQCAPADLYSDQLPCSINSGDVSCDSREVHIENSCCGDVFFGCEEACGGDWDPVTVTIGGLVGTKHLLNQSLRLIAQTSSLSDPVYRWWVAPANQPEARTLLTPPGADLTGFDPGASELSIDPRSQAFGPGTYIFTLDVANRPGACIGNFGRTQRTVSLVHTLSALAPGRAFPGDTIRIYGETFIPGEDILVRIDDDTDHSTVAYEMTATATEGHWVEITLPSDIAEGQVYRVAVAAPDGEGESSWKAALEIVYSGYDEPGTDDPSCTGVGQEAANPIVPGQTVTGNFCGEGDTDYFYFPAAAGTTFDISLERVDDSLSVYDPTSIDPELFVINPDGVAPASGYANDNSADDTNASLSGFTTTQTGLYGIACRTSRASGQYRLTVTRTGTPAAANFSVVPYGDRSIAVIPQAGGNSTATLHALAFDPRGLPAAGAAVNWQEISGAPAGSQAYLTSTQGLGQGSFTLSPGASTTLKPAFDWAAGPGKMVAEDGEASLPPPASSGALLGIVHFSPDVIVTSSRLPDPARAEEIVAAAHKAKVAAGGGKAPVSKLMNACTDPGAGAQTLSEITFPAGAVSIEGFSIELTDEGGVALGENLSGLKAGEKHDLGVRLIAHCLDDGGNPFDAPLSYAPIALGSSGETRDDLAGGIVKGSSTCQYTNIDAASGGNWTPLTHELGKRAILSGIDDADEAHFVFTELFGASIALKTQAPDGRWTVIRGKSEVEVQPEHGEPAEIRWLEPRDLHEVATGGFVPTAEDPQDPASAEYIQGPQFIFLDTWGNLTPLWGRNDSRWRRESSDEISVRSPGAWGEAPWVGLKGSEGIFQPWVFVKAGDLPAFSGQARWSVCAQTSTTEVCDSFSLDNTGDLNIINLQPPWPQDCNYSGCNSGGYVSDAEAFDPSATRTSPGGPLLYHPSGKPVLIRIHPVNTRDLLQEHSHPFTDVPVRVWLSGPSASPDGLHFRQEDAGEDLRLVQETDVEFCSGVMTQGAGGVISASCDQLHQGEATLTASTDDLDIDGVGLLGTVIGITKAPAEPGWYTVMVESDDSRFNAAGQRKWRAGWKFAVMGGRFLDENWEPIEVFVADTPTQAHFVASGGLLPVGLTTVEVSSFNEANETVSEAVRVSLEPDSSGSLLVGALAFVPKGYPESTGLDGPEIDVDLGRGYVEASIPSGKVAGVLGGVLANAALGLRGKLTFRFLNRDCTQPTESPDPGHPELAGTVQETEIGNESDNYAEIVCLELSVRNPFSPFDPPRNFSGEVGLYEKWNSRYAEKQFYQYPQFGGVQVLSDGRLWQQGSTPYYPSLQNGSTVVSLKSTALRRTNRSTGEVQWGSYSDEAGAIIFSSPISTADPLAPLDSDDLQIDQWVDERSYSRRRENPTGSWQDQVPDPDARIVDWFEKRVWDLFTTEIDNQSGELDEAIERLYSIREVDLSSDRRLGFVSCSEDPHRINTDPWKAQRFRLPSDIPSRGSYYWGFYRSTRDLTKNLVFHELRHIWQCNVAESRGAIDDDHDGLFLPGSLPVTSSDLFDDFNLDSGEGLSGDGHFLTDCAFCQDDSDTVRMAREHNAIRFENSVGTLDTFTCAYESIDALSPISVSGPVGQTLEDPIRVEVRWIISDDPDSAPGAGVTVRFSVQNGCDATVDGESTAWAMTQGGPSPSAQADVMVGTQSCTIMAEVVPPMSPPGECTLLGPPVVFKVDPE